MGGFPPAPLTTPPVSVPGLASWRCRDCREDVELPLAPHVVVLGGTAARRVAHVDGGLVEQRPCARHIASELRRRRPDQRDRARDVGRSHRGPAEQSIGRIAPARRGADTGARCGNVGLDDASERRRASRREACNRARLRERAGAVVLRIVPRRPGRATSRAVVSVREGREDPGRDPRLNGRAEERIA